ncbi:MAG: PorP/SprF family type IX secretion system membrane protein [Bacteroidetes bacterium]|nr:PorP/SprF family type IX secretion system membrane protein [Bacteroidota bacterium]
MRIFFTLLVIFIFGRLYSQPIVSELPVHFGQYFYNPQINPAKGCIRSDVELYAFSRRNSNSFGGVFTSAFSAFFRIMKKNNGFNSIGIDFYSDREGPVLSRNRAHLSFSRHQKINDTWFFSAGLSFGLYNFSVKPTDYAAGASASTIDGNGGVMLYSSTTRIGLSINQYTNTKARPVDQVIHLNRHFYLLGEHDFIVNESFSITPSVFAKFTPALINPYLQKVNIGASFLLLIKKMVSFGGGYDLREGFYGFAGIQNIPIPQNGKTNRLSIDFAYFMPQLSNTRTNTQAYEIMVRYLFGKGDSAAAPKSGAADCPTF